MVNDATIRELAKQSVQGLEPEPTAVLADALLETDRADLGEDLALILSNRRPFPREERGRAFQHWSDRERALKVIFRRMHRRFTWSRYDDEEQQRALRELRGITSNWNRESREYQDGEIERATNWLEEDAFAALQTPANERFVSTLRERAGWLMDGSFGRGAQILAEEIIDTPASRHNQEAQLFRLVLAFDDNLPPSATNRIWDELSVPAKRLATSDMRHVIVEQGGEIRTPPARPKRSRKR